MHTPIIAAQLAQLGFATRITQFGVIVSLNRPMSTMEVEQALVQEFDTIEFKVSQVSKNQVMVQE